jgi:hypothetical protein
LGIQDFLYQVNQSGGGSGFSAYTSQAIAHGFQFFRALEQVEGDRCYGIGLQVACQFWDNFLLRPDVGPRQLTPSLQGNLGHPSCHHAAQSG